MDDFRMTMTIQKNFFQRLYKIHLFTKKKSHAF